MWLINDEGHKTFIEANNFNLFAKKGWKKYFPEVEEKVEAKEVKQPVKRKVNKKK
jgi:hypothetical protein